MHQLKYSRPNFQKLCQIEMCSATNKNNFEKSYQQNAKFHLDTQNATVDETIVKNSKRELNVSNTYFINTY